MGPARRTALLASAQCQAAADLAFIRTHYQANVWAGRGDLAMTPRMDEAMGVSPNQSGMIERGRAHTDVILHPRSIARRSIAHRDTESRGAPAKR